MCLRVFLLKQAMFILSLLLLGVGMASAQSQDPFTDASTRASEEKDRPMGRPEREFAYRALIARATAEHKQNLKRAGDSATLALSVQRAFEQNGLLSSEQIKNLQQIERLARRIRGYAGGSDDGAALDDLPADTRESLTRIADVAARLQQEVEKTSRQVVSAQIITSANELIALIRHTRNLSRS